MSVIKSIYHAGRGGLEHQDQIAPSELVTADLPGAALLLSRSFGGRPEWYLSYFRHWWEDNPCWNVLIPRGWAVKSSIGDVIAFTANIPFEYRINGSPALCCTTGSTGVDERWRGYGLAKLVGRCFVQQPKASLLVGTGSTDVAYRIWLSLGMKPLTRAWPARSCCIVGNVTEYANAKLRLPKTAVRIGGALEKAAYGALLSSTRGRHVFEIENVNRFDAKDDEDLLACRASDASIYSLRDAKTLNWLYFSPFIRDSRVVFAATSGKRILGYIALKRQEHLLLLLECRTRDLDAGVARALFGAAQEYAVRQRISYIRVWRYAPMIAEALPKLGCVISKRTPMMTYCYKANVKIEERDWEATPGDGDLSVN